MYDFGRLRAPAFIAGSCIFSMPTIAGAKMLDGSNLCDVVTVQVENDAFGGTDRHYTGGVRLACTRRPPAFLRGPNFLATQFDAVTETRSTYSIGQSVFTPDDLSLSEPIEDDHPYAGWLYFGFGLEREVVPISDRPRYLDNVELQLGVVGPLAGAEQAQTIGHDLLDATDPQGWGNQLDNEPGLNLFYSRQWTGIKETRLKPFNSLPEMSFDVTPKLGLALGNIHIFGAGGMIFRLGSFQPGDHGPPVIRPRLPGSDFFPIQDGFSAYLFGGVEGRAVARNIFLDGNSFQDDGPSVDRNNFVGEGRLGFALIFDDVRLTYTQVLRSPEFDGQIPQIFGSVTLSLGF